MPKAQKQPVGYDGRFEQSFRLVPDPYEPGAERLAAINVRHDIITTLYEGTYLPRGRQGRPLINRAQHRAGNRFQELVESAQRQSSLSCDPTREPVDGGRTLNEFTDRQAVAFRELRRVHREIGDRHYRLAYDVLGRGVPLYALAKKKNRWQEKVVAREFRHVLTLMAIFWGYDNASPPPVDNVRSMA